LIFIPAFFIQDHYLFSTYVRAVSKLQI